MIQKRMMCGAGGSETHNVSTYLLKPSRKTLTTCAHLQETVRLYGGFWVKIHLQHAEGRLGYA